MPGLACLVAMLSLLSVAGDTEIKCVTPGDRIEYGMEYAVGWYNGDEDIAYLVNDLSFEYSREVLQHELAHAWDLAKGTELNGTPSFFSETHTGFDIEQFARLQTLWLGAWPVDEVYPDVIPTDDEWDRMNRAGWLIKKEQETP
jgi:hypothetical protein